MQTTKHVDVVGTCVREHEATFGDSFSSVLPVCVCRPYVYTILATISASGLASTWPFALAVLAASANPTKVYSLYCSNGGSSCPPIIFVRINDCAWKSSDVGTECHNLSTQIKMLPRHSHTNTSCPRPSLPPVGSWGSGALGSWQSSIECLPQENHKSQYLYVTLYIIIFSMSSINIWYVASINKFG